MRISDWSSDVCSSDLRGPPYARATTVRGHTMHFKPEEIPLITPESGSGGGGCMRSIKAGEMEIGFTWTTGPRDYTPLYAGLPGGVCPCDHYGYVFSGRIRARYADGSEEVIGPGEVYRSEGH